MIESNLIWLCSRLVCVQGKICDLKLVAVCTLSKSKGAARVVNSFLTSIQNASWPLNLRGSSEKQNSRKLRFVCISLHSISLSYTVRYRLGFQSVPQRSVVCLPLDPTRHYSFDSHSTIALTLKLYNNIYNCSSSHSLRAGRIIPCF